jgi:hypothetical protein
MAKKEQRRNNNKRREKGSQSDRFHARTGKRETFGLDEPNDEDSQEQEQIPRRKK